MAWLLFKGRQQARAISVERERLYSIIEGAGSCTWEMNFVTGARRAGERWAMLLGFDKAKLPADSGAFFRSRFHPDDLSRSDELMQRHLLGIAPELGANCVSSTGRAVGSG